MFAVKEDTLTDMVDAMKEDIGLVHQMPFTCDGAGLPSTLEKVKVNKRQSFVILSRPDIDLTIWLLVTNNLHLGPININIHKQILKISRIETDIKEKLNFFVREEIVFLLNKTKQDYLSYSVID